MVIYTQQNKKKQLMMQTDAVFENIAERIQKEIGKAKKSVFIAVAWFTNKNLFNQQVNIDIANWDEYFNRIKEILQSELEELTQEIGTVYGQK